jgi:hypothetical protein
LHFETFSFLLSGRTIATMLKMAGKPLALLVGVVTESVLLLGYVIAGASLLLAVGMLLRRAVRRFTGSRVRWLQNESLASN